MLNSAINGREAAITVRGAGVAWGGGEEEGGGAGVDSVGGWGGGGRGGPLWFILIGAQSFVLKGEGETGCWKHIPVDQLELCNKNTLIVVGTFA